MRTMRRLAPLLLCLALAGCQLSWLPQPTATPAARLPLPPPAASATPAATAAPPTPAATPSPTLPPNDLQAVRRARNEALPRDPIMLAQAFRGVAQEAPISTPTPPPAQPLEEFWVTDITGNTHYTVSARLAYQSDRLLFYAAEGVAVAEPALRSSAQTFNDATLPRLLQMFQGQLEAPPQITVLLAPLSGAGGYYSAEDELPASVNPVSNERPMVFMNSDAYAPASADFDRTLAHEIQHLLHHRLQPNPSSWFNEGLSTLAERLLGYQNMFMAEAFIRSPDVQLNSWAATPGEALGHYGAAQLFLSYLHERKDGAVPWAELARADAGERPELLLSLLGERSLGQLVADWATANLLDDPGLADGRFAYEALPAPVEPDALPAAGVSAEVHQLAADYLLIEPAEHARQLQFEGEVAVPVTAAELPAGELAWWSGRGDGRVATLTRTIDLRDVSAATLRYKLWYDLERGYDYAFLAASTDNGETWRTLRTRYGTNADPHGLNYGFGYSGASDGASGEGPAVWLQEEIDLTPFVGAEIQLGFWVVNDQGYNAPGMLLRELEIPQLKLRPEPGWRATGFVRARNRLPQRWAVRLVLLGDRPEVQRAVVQDGAAELSVPPHRRAVLIVVATTPETTEPGRYRVRIAP